MNKQAKERGGNVNRLLFLKNFGGNDASSTENIERTTHILEELGGLTHKAALALVGVDLDVLRAADLSEEEIRRRGNLEMQWWAASISSGAAETHGLHPSELFEQAKECAGASRAPGFTPHHRKRFNLTHELLLQVQWTTTSPSLFWTATRRRSRGGCLETW